MSHCKKEYFGNKDSKIFGLSEGNCYMLMNFFIFGVFVASYRSDWSSELSDSYDLRYQEIIDMMCLTEERID